MHDCGSELAGRRDATIGAGAGGVLLAGPAAASALGRRRRPRDLEGDDDGNAR